MAKTIVQLKNGLRVKYIVNAKKYYLYTGSMAILIDGEYQNGFKSEQEAVSLGNSLSKDGMYERHWKKNN